MKSFIIASAIAGLAQASVLSTATGQAKVVSNCQENVYVSNVACDTSVAPINTVLNSSNPTYTQNFAAVSGGCGWSIKLGSDASLPGDNIIQYEYTWQGSGQPVWYDMSLVNQEGTAVFPWSFSSSNTAVCDPNNANYFTDATTTTGMQTSCPDDVTLTLYLCGSGSSSGSSSSAASSSAAPSSTSSSAAASSSSSSSSSAAPVTSSAASSAPASSSKSQTTLATSTKKSHGGWTVQQANVAPASTVTTSAAVSSSALSSSTAANGVVVTETDVFYVTEVATTYVQARNAEATPAPHERRHAHGHAHGHPHGVRA